MTERARLVSFFADGAERYGVAVGDGVVDLSRDLGARFGSLQDAVVRAGLGDVVAAAKGRDTDFSLAEVTFRIPVAAPEKIICVGVNFPDRNAEYKDGQAEAARPSLFVRFPRSFTGHNAPLVLPPESEKLDYEGEIAIVIGKAGRRIPREAAYEHIAALTLCNEGTIRDWVRHAKFNVTQGKNWDRSGSMGPWLVPFEDASQLDDVALECRVNGEVRQEDRTGRMIYDFRYIVNYVSTFTTLVPGDVLVCGTPTGAGARFDPPVWLKPGDVIEVEAEGIGVLRNTVAAET